MANLRASIVISEEQQAVLSSELQALTMTVEKATQIYPGENQTRSQELPPEVPELQPECHTRLHAMNDAKLETLHGAISHASLPQRPGSVFCKIVGCDY
eukprot:COSAG02_NODE_54612_length_295_cov_0.770408_1_plen_98_part_11